MAEKGTGNHWRMFRWLGVTVYAYVLLAGSGRVGESWWVFGGELLANCKASFSRVGELHVLLLFVMLAFEGLYWVKRRQFAGQAVRALAQGGVVLAFIEYLRDGNVFGIAFWVFFAYAQSTRIQPFDAPSEGRVSS